MGVRRDFRDHLAQPHSVERGTTGLRCGIRAQDTDSGSVHLEEPDFHEAGGHSSRAPQQTRRRKQRQRRAGRAGLSRSLVVGDVILCIKKWVEFRETKGIMNHQAGNSRSHYYSRLEEVRGEGSSWDSKRAFQQEQGSWWRDTVSPV